MSEQQYPRVDGNRPYGQPMPNSAPSTSAMAVTGLVLGIVALVTSALPIINNFSFFLAALGAIFAIIGLVATVRKTRKGKVLAVVGLVLSVVSIVVVLASQSMYSAAIDKAVSGPGVVGTSTSAANDQGAPSDPSPKADYSNLSVGGVVDLDDGLSVCVQSVQPGLKNYDGSEIVGVAVTYTNNGSSEASFNVFDWKAQDAQGAQRNTAYYSESENELNSGTLAPGGTVTGNVYFDGGVTKVLYYSNMFSDSTVAWIVS